MFQIPLDGSDICRFCFNGKPSMKFLSMDAINFPKISQLFKEVTTLEVSIILIEIFYFALYKFFFVQFYQLKIYSEYPAYICNDCELSLQTCAETLKKFREVDYFWQKYLGNAYTSSIDDSFSHQIIEELNADEKPLQLENMKLEEADTYDDVYNDIEENAEYLKIEMMDDIPVPPGTTVQYLCGVCGTGNIENVVCII